MATKTTDTPSQATTSPTQTPQRETAEQQPGQAHVSPVQRAAAGALPPPNGVPSATRAADLMTRSVEAPSAIQRAHLMRAMQGTVGNARVERMLGPDSGAAAADRQAAPQTAPLSVSPPDTPAEKEAEAVAQRVAIGQPAPREASPAGATTSSSASAASEPPHPRPDQASAQRKAHSPDGDPVPVEDRQAAAEAMANKGAGSPVSQSLRQEMEPKLGADLSQARVHTDGPAQTAAHALQARAFTQGSDVYLGHGQSEHDKSLMAHELTHVVQNQSGVQRAVRAEPTVEPPVQRAAKTGAKGAAAKADQAADAVAPGVVNLQQPALLLPPETADFVASHQDAVVQAQFGKLAAGPLRLAKARGGYTARRQTLPLSHPLFAAGGSAAATLAPQLQVEVGPHGEIRGKVVVAGGELAKKLQQAPETIGLPGFQLRSTPSLTNAIENGQLHLGLKGVPIRLGAAFDGSLDLDAINERVTSFNAQAMVSVGGLQSGELKLERDEAGVISGKVSLQVQVSKNVSGAVDVVWDGRAVTGQGKVGYQGEKLSGNVTVNLMEKAEAERLKREKQAPSKEGKVAQAPVKPAVAKEKGKKVDYAVFGEGDLTFAFTDWLTGTAHVILDHEGHATIIGQITPQKEFTLFEQKDYVKPLPKLEARAAYGIPVVGNIFIFANVGLDLFAKLGPGKFYNIVVDGTYSTDPGISKDFSIRGSFNLSAAAGLRLRGEAGAGLEILDHDIKAGAGVNGIAGIRGYAEATPIVGYREKSQGPEDKKGEFFIRGELEIAAQPFLGLSGDLFVELDAPWWSPLSDDKWTWPLGSKEWPIGGSLGMKASVDYVFGSNQWPTVEFQPVDFSADKFFTDLYHDKAQPKSGEAPDQKGKWSEQNSPAAPPPAAPEKSGGGATPGKAAEPPAAQPKVKPGGAKQGGKGVDPNAKTAEGKSVKQLQDEATKKGKGDKKAADKTAPKGADKPESSANAQEPTTHADEPISMPLSMAGQQHKLILTAGSSPRVEIESKRDLLSNKVGRAIARLMAMTPRPTAEIEQLRSIGQQAKELQRKANEAKINPKKRLNETPGSTALYNDLKANIEYYGNHFHKNDIEQYLGEATTQSLRDRIKELLEKAYHIPPAEYSNAKHWRGNSEDQRRQNSEENRPGQFLYAFTAQKVKELERDAFLTGDIEDRGNGTYWAYKKFSKQIGYANGGNAYLLRAEMTNVGSGRPSVHSHPHD